MRQSIFHKKMLSHMFVGGMLWVNKCGLQTATVVLIMTFSRENACIHEDISVKCYSFLSRHEWHHLGA